MVGEPKSTIKLDSQWCRSPEVNMQIVRSALLNQIVQSRWIDGEIYVRLVNPNGVKGTTHYIERTRERFVRQNPINHLSNQTADCWYHTVEYQDEPGTSKNIEGRSGVIEIRAPLSLAQQVNEMVSGSVWHQEAITIGDGKGGESILHPERDVMLPGYMGVGYHIDRCSITQGGLESFVANRSVRFAPESLRSMTFLVDYCGTHAIPYSVGAK